MNVFGEFSLSFLIINEVKRSFLKNEEIIIKPADQVKSLCPPHSSVGNRASRSFVGRQLVGMNACPQRHAK